jgi:hypothetical protein
MRLWLSTDDRASDRNVKFAATLLELGDGRLQLSDYSTVRLDGVTKKNFPSEKEAANVLIDFVYSNLNSYSATDQDELSSYLNGQ